MFLFFLLRSYFLNEHDGEPLGMIDLTKAARVEMKTTEKQEKPFGFTLTMKNGRIYHLAAFTAIEAGVWVMFAFWLSCN